MCVRDVVAEAVVVAVALVAVGLRTDQGERQRRRRNVLLLFLVLRREVVVLLVLDLGRRRRLVIALVLLLLAALPLLLLRVFVLVRRVPRRVRSRPFLVAAALA